ncbi:MAG TPA: molybdopterin-dependent oxidoreductase [Coriobacteriia bacterium]|nr:molybdopterin-dependent oxidoreductase [Coriobacteriia bacterium]
MRVRLITCLTAVAVLAAALLSGCSGVPKVPGTGSTETPTKRLAPAEVLQYKGKRLDSVDDFRENSIKGPQTVDIKAYRLKVLGEVSKPLTLTYDQAIDRTQYEKVVRLNCVEGWSVDILWEGVLISDLLEQAGYDRSAKVVIFRCKDGYSTSLPLDFVVGNKILLASKMNGVDLPRERGFPFQVVAEDKWGYKWAKWVTSIEVSNDASFEGFWEKRGYDNSGDLPKK